MPTVKLPMKQYRLSDIRYTSCGHRPIADPRNGLREMIDNLNKPTCRPSYLVRQQLVLRHRGPKISRIKAMYALSLTL